jgi:hypothetical protein
MKEFKETFKTFFFNEKVNRFCAWCGKSIEGENTAVGQDKRDTKEYKRGSHGICYNCLDKIKKESLNALTIGNNAFPNGPNTFVRQTQALANPKINPLKSFSGTNSSSGEKITLKDLIKKVKKINRLDISYKDKTKLWYKLNVHPDQAKKYITKDI